MRKLLTIYDSFELKDHGTVVTGRCWDDGLQLSAGDNFILILPAGQRYHVTALDVTKFTKCFSEGTILGVQLGGQFPASQIPHESEIWVEV